MNAKRGRANTAGSTSERILDAALLSFGTSGFDATSLDQLASELGLAKQTILYYFASKEALLDAVIERGAAELSDALEEALVDAGPAFATVEAVVRSVFRLAGRRPELLGLLREVSRLGAPAAALHRPAILHGVLRLGQRAALGGLAERGAAGVDGVQEQGQRPHQGDRPHRYVGA